MKRVIALLGGGCLLAAGLALTSAGVRAEGTDAEEDLTRRVEKRVEVVRVGEGGFLGVSLEEVEGSARGARVRSVEPESAAEQAGVQDGDVITRFDGEAVRSARQLARLVRETPPGREVLIEVERGGSTKTLTATLAEGANLFHRRLFPGDGPLVLPDLGDHDIEIEVPEGLPHGPSVFSWHGDGDHDFTMSWPGRPRLGVLVMDIGEQLAAYFELSAEEAVLVSGVTEGSPAAEAGIQAGDIILEFDGRPVRDGGDLRAGVRRAKGGEPVTVKLHRDGRAQDVTVSLPKPEKPKRLLRRESGVSL